MSKGDGAAARCISHTPTLAISWLATNVILLYRSLSCANANHLQADGYSNKRWEKFTACPLEDLGDGARATRTNVSRDSGDPETAHSNSWDKLFGVNSRERAKGEKFHSLRLNFLGKECELDDLASLVACWDNAILVEAIKELLFSSALSSADAAVVVAAVVPTTLKTRGSCNNDDCREQPPPLTLQQQSLQVGDFAGIAGVLMIALVDHQNDQLSNLRWPEAKSNSRAFPPVNGDHVTSVCSFPIRSSSCCCCCPQTLLMLSRLSARRPHLLLAVGHLS